ncbi:MAG: aconitase family protein [bacterium]
MTGTLIEKILAAHTSGETEPGAMVELGIDVRAARDFGGASVAAHIREHGLGVADPGRTFFTFDCNPTGSDQGYAANQHRCRRFAREHGVGVYDITRGIGTHVVMEEGHIAPGSTFVSTDSHANILGAVLGFGQGMGDVDIAHAFAHGTVWFKVPPSVHVRLAGRPGPHAAAKDLTLALVGHLGAKGLLGRAAEVSGPAVESLSLAGRITLASMATEMGAIILFPAPGPRTPAQFTEMSGLEVPWPTSDPDAEYEEEVEMDVEGLGPLVSRPGRPDDVIPVEEAAGTPLDSGFIGSCTNGRLEDLEAAARVLEDAEVREGVVLKVVPATDRVWVRALKGGVVDRLKEAGALFSNAGCAGCAAGQVGQTGPGEAEISTGNRNFPGKQGLGEVWLASPETVAASTAAGEIVAAHELRSVLDRTSVTLPRSPTTAPPRDGAPAGSHAPPAGPDPPMVVEGRAWVLEQDSVDTDMIYHNRHLAVTDPDEMGRYALGNVPGWEDFPDRVRPGDILVVGENFGAGSSRQQAVDCFLSLEVGAIVGPSFGSIYERNAINAGLPLLAGDLREELESGDEVRLDMGSGRLERLSDGEVLEVEAMSEIQERIYRRGGLLAAREGEG